MADTFDQEIAQLRQKINGKKNQLSKERNMTQKLKLDYVQDLNDFQEQLDTLGEKIDNQAKGTLTRNQVLERRKLHEELKTILADLRNNLQPSAQQQKDDLFGKAQPKTFKDAYGESEDPEQIKRNINKQKEESDKKINALNEGVIKTKIVAGKIGNELDDQLEKLDVIQYKAEQNTAQMMKTSQKMEKLIKESSSWAILLTIFAEIAILVLILIYM